MQDRISAPAKIVLFAVLLEHGPKSSLLEMVVRRQRFGQTSLCHHRKGDTIRQRPIFIQPALVEI